MTHPLGIGALEFARVYHNEDVHQVYLNMFLNTGWIGGTLYLFLVLTTLALGLRQAMRDRGGNGVSNVMVAAFFGMALEGLVIDTDHWRHLYLIMAMIWGLGARPVGRRRHARHAAANALGGGHFARHEGQVARSARSSGDWSR